MSLLQSIFDAISSKRSDNQLVYSGSSDWAEQYVEDNISPIVPIVEKKYVMLKTPYGYYWALRVFDKTSGRRVKIADIAISYNTSGIRYFERKRYVAAPFNNMKLHEERLKNLKSDYNC